MEDALLAQAQQSTQALEQLQQLSGSISQLELALNATLEDNQAYNLMTTDPQLLAEYTNEFFGPNGPYPVVTAQDRLAADVVAAEGGMQAYQRPQLQIPAPSPQGGGGINGFWDAFEEVQRRQPDQAWRVLSQATPDVLRQKLLISDAPAV